MTQQNALLYAAFKKVFYSTSHKIGDAHINFRIQTWIDKKAFINCLILEQKAAQRRAYNSSFFMSLVEAPDSTH